MKAKRITAAIFAAAMAVSMSACQSGGPVEGNNDSAVSSESISSLVTSANSSAATIKNQMATFLTNMDASKSGMKFGSNSAIITINVEGGVWKVTNSNVDAFRSGSYIWNGSGSSDSGSEDGAEDKLAADLADLFPNLETAGIASWWEGGQCMAVTFTADSSYPDSQTYALLGEGGWTSSTCEWDGQNDGVSTSGLIVGTSPCLKMS